MSSIGSENVEQFTVLQLRRNREVIKKISGVYLWCYSPKIHISSSKEFLDSLNRIAQIKPRIVRTGNVWNDKVSIEYSAFNNKSIFRTDSTKYNFLIENAENKDFRIGFANEIIRLCEIAVVFYIGKADDLRKRINNHVEGISSNLLSDLYKNGIKENEVVVKTIYDEDSFYEKFNDVNLVLEEIIQRIAEPGYVKRYG